MSRGHPPTPYLEQQYAHFLTERQSKWAELRPSDGGVRASNLAELRDYIREEYVIAPGRELPISEHETEIIARARDFVAITLDVPVDCTVRKYTQVSDNQLMRAFYDAPTHTILYAPLDPDSTFASDATLEAILVHEFTHSTIAPSLSAWDFVDEEGGHNISYATPHEVTAPHYGHGGDHFFEEALAEEIANRWRTQFDPRPQGNVDSKVSMANHSSQYGYSCPMYSTEAVRTLGHYSGVDLFQLLIDARRPDQQERASATLKQVVDAIEPDLYELLISARYSYEDFTDGLDIVHQAIRTSIRERNK